MRLATESLHPHARQDTLLVLLTPAKAVLEDFIAQGHVAAVRQRRLAVDLLLAEATSQEILERSIIDVLHQRVILPARTAGYRHIWLCGISLGAFVALHYVARHADLIAGVHLLAPYPGTGDVLDEMRVAGGPLEWAKRPRLERADERVWWAWVCANARCSTLALPVYLSLSREDRFSEGQAVLASLLPAHRVNLISGSHAWPTWNLLWSHWLDGMTGAAAFPIARP